jgi:4-hydroxy-2-oxoheptanedioate aldolase
MKRYIRNRMTGFLFVTLVCITCQQEKPETAWVPKRLNKAIELWEAGQPVYYKSAYGGYREGKEMSQTWADIILYNMEHKPVDFGLLREFMQGLVDGGPTPSGHRTPAVVALVPALGVDTETFKGGSWMIQQALAQGVHGIHLCRARDPDAVKLFVQNARYPVHKQAIDVVGEGLRGWGSHLFAATIWGLSREAYLTKADVWPLNPDGELILGVKIEDPQALKNAEKSLAVPGIAFAEHGPRDHGLSHGYLEGRADPPVPDIVNAAGDKVLELCNQHGLFFLDNVLPENVAKQIDRGVMIGAGSNEAAAVEGRKYTRRKMPW